MPQPAHRSMILATAFVVVFAAIRAEPAMALVQTFVSGTGGGTTCGRTSPCADFATALAATDDGGQVTCLDAGSFGSFTINKSITIDCTGTDAVIAGIVVNAPHRAVTLRGLGLQGSLLILAGVLVSEVGALHIEFCRISGYTGGGDGVLISPTAANARVYISDTLISDNIGSSGGFGINVIASGAAGARVVLNRVRVENNFYGIVGDGQSGSSTTVVSVHVRDSIVSGNSQAGISGKSTVAGAITSIVLDRTSSTLSTQGTGVAADGSPVFFLLGRSAVTSNGTGMTANSGAHILSYQNNQLNGNVTDAFPTGVLSLR